MSFYSEMAEVAAELLEEFGRSVTVVKMSQTHADASQPWLGFTDAETARPVNGVFLAMGGIGFTVVQTDERSPRDAEMHVLVAAGDSGLQAGDELETFTELRDGADIWAITGAVPLTPGDTKLIYDLTLEAVR